MNNSTNHFFAGILLWGCWILFVFAAKEFESGDGVAGFMGAIIAIVSAHKTIMKWKAYTGN